MVKEFMIDGIQLNREYLNGDFSYLRKKLELPGWFGDNLDALYDCLTTIGVDTKIKLVDYKVVNDKLLQTFIDASVENPHLTVIVIGD